MRALRSVSGQLITALVVLVLVALATSYLVVVPTLDHQLVSNRLNELERSAAGIAFGVTSGDSFFLQSRVENSASALDVRIVVFQELGPPQPLVVLADSLRTGSSAIESDPVALAAARSGRVVRGTLRWRYRSRGNPSLFCSRSLSPRRIRAWTRCASSS
jgi:hypothetical protein